MRNIKVVQNLQLLKPRQKNKTDIILSNRLGYFWWMYMIYLPDTHKNVKNNISAVLLILGHLPVDETFH